MAPEREVEMRTLHTLAALALLMLAACAYYDESSEALIKDARRGDLEAQYNLALSYSDPDYPDMNYREAYHWFNKAAGQGHPESQYRVGLCYAEGRGVEKDEDAARDWLSKAAQHRGLKDAQYRLGTSLLQSAVPDSAEAWFWLAVAAQNGHPEAIQAWGKKYPGLDDARRVEILERVNRWFEGQ